jgi:outer membrane protein OmpA-like peptidoglycan-associated protein
MNYKLFIPLVVWFSMESCAINSKDEYMKSPLSGFVQEDYSAYMDKALEDEINPIKSDLSNLKSKMNQFAATCCGSSNDSIENDIQRLESQVLANNVMIQRALSTGAIFFELNSFIINESAKYELYHWYNRLALTSATHGNVEGLTIQIASYTDQTGDQSLNSVLNQARSVAVRDFLVKNFGFSTEQIEIQSIPVNHELPDPYNRRTEFWISFN